MSEVVDGFASSQDGMNWRIVPGDCVESLRSLPDGCVQTCITSPPYYGLRDYGHEGQIGLEESPAEYVARLVEVFREVRRVLRDDGTLWLNLGDSYAGTGYGNHAINGEKWLNDAGLDRRSSRQQALKKAAEREGIKPKDLLGIPWMVAFALRDDGWFLRSEIIWAKPNPMPESVTDRPTKAHEQVFLLAKSPRYFYDADAVREENTPDMLLRASRGHVRGGGVRDASRNDATTLVGGPVDSAGRNKRTVWTVATQPFSGAHFAVFPPKLIEPMVLAGSSDRACAECGQAWERVVEREPSDMDARYARGEPSRHGTQGAAASSASNVGWFSGESRTVGFEPACTCNAGTSPSVVLDPFAGSGTTGMVALRHGRSFIGCELNREYVELARRRIVDDAPLLNQMAEVVPGV